MITLYRILYSLGLFRKKYRFLFLKQQFDAIESEIKEHSYYFHKPGVLVNLTAVQQDFNDYKRYFRKIKRYLFSLKDTGRITDECFNDLFQRYKYIRTCINVFNEKLRSA